MESQYSVASDHELQQVVAELELIDPQGRKFAEVIRSTLDQLLDGPRRGRFDYKDLHKTEKTHMGTLVEINLAREFDFPDGDAATDFTIAGIPVDCKFSQKLQGWEIGPHLFGYLCLVIWASDDQSLVRVGVVRAREDIMTPRPNQDLKRKISSAGAAYIHWLWGGPVPMRENALLHMDPVIRARIMSARGRRVNGHGQARLNELARSVQGRILDRVLIATVGHGLDDPMKRMREDGGARTFLREEGYLVLGHQERDPVIAAALGVPVPTKGSFVSIRVAPATPGDADVAEIEGIYWRIARSDDAVHPAPFIPKARKSKP